MKKNLLTAIFLTFISLNAIAQSSMEIVDNFLNTTGILKQLEQIDQVVDSKINEKKASFENEEFYQKFSQIMRSGFNSENASVHFKDYYVNNANEEKLRQITASYQEPLIQQMTKYEENSSDPANQEEQIAFFTNLESNPPSQERIQKMATLNEAIGATELFSTIMKNMIYSMINGANLMSDEADQISTEEIESQINSSLSPEMLQQLNYQLIAFSLYTYKDASDQEVQEYIEYWESPNGKYQLELMINAFNYSFTQMGENIGQSLMSIKKS